MTLCSLLPEVTYNEFRKFCQNREGGWGMHTPHNLNLLGQHPQVREKPFNAIIVIYGIMVKVGLTVRCHIWYH